MTPDEILAAYEARHGLADCRLDASGRAAFDMGAGLVVLAEFGPDRNALMLQAAVPVQGGAGPDLMGRLLASNLYCRGPGSPVAAYDRTAGEIVVLAGLDPRHADVEAFEECLGDLVESAEYWRDARDGTPGDAPGPGGFTAPPGMVDRA